MLPQWFPNSLACTCLGIASSLSCIPSWPQLWRLLFDSDKHTGCERHWMWMLKVESQVLTKDAAWLKFTQPPSLRIWISSTFPFPYVRKSFWSNGSWRGWRRLLEILTFFSLLRGSQCRFLLPLLHLILLHAPPSPYFIASSKLYCGGAGWGFGLYKATETKPDEMTYPLSPG